MDGTIPRDFQPLQPSVLGGDFLGGIWHQQAQRCSYQSPKLLLHSHSVLMCKNFPCEGMDYKGILLFLTCNQANPSAIQLISLFSLYSCVSLEFEISLCERARINKVLSVMLLSNCLIQVFRQNAFIFLFF